MAELNEEQLLLLNNMMYYDGAATNGSTVEDIANRLLDIADNYDKDSLALSGGFEKNPDQIREIAEAILKDDQLCDMVVVDSINTDGVRASCFVDAEGDATVAVRGTGGTYEAWSDNVEGAYGTGTECQEAFREFIQEQSQYYDDMTVTGHSKGGNLAQYATVLEGDSIDRCVSFDGQGFNDDFCDTYKDQISANQDKIKSICAEGDYVNILMHNIAGETVYLETTDGENAHSSYALWQQNQGLMQDGEYSATVSQDGMMDKLDDIVDVVVDAIGWLPDAIERPIVDFLGSVVGLIFASTTGQLTWDNVVDAIMKYMKAEFATSFPGVAIALDWIEDKLNDLVDQFKKEEENENGRHGGGGRRRGEMGGKCKFVANCTQMIQSAGELGDCETKLEGLINTVDGIKLSSTQYLQVNLIIRNLESQLRQDKSVLDALQNALLGAQKLYQSTEKKLCVVAE